MSTPGTSATPMRHNGLVLTGGGARAAYQAGVLKGISELLRLGPEEPSPFSVVTGVSAGAINGAFLASQSESFTRATEGLYALWYDLAPDRILNTQFGSLAALGTGWIRDLGLGGLTGKTRSNFLIDTAPLRKLLEQHVDVQRIRRNLSQGHLRGVAVSATNYRTGTAVTFFEGAPEIEPWARSARIGERAELTLDHVLASAAIPVFFKPVRVGQSHFGDGGIRLSTPLSPAIHLGADRILAIGIRHPRSGQVTADLNRGLASVLATGLQDAGAVQALGDISLADISGVLMNALFLDALDADLERMERINQTLSMLSPEARQTHPHRLRSIPVFAIRPSKDLGSLASEQFDQFPFMLRYLLKGLGASKEKGWDLLSYLAFDASYTRKIAELGRADALRQRDQILAFLTES